MRFGLGDSSKRRVWTSRSGRRHKVVLDRYVLVSAGRGGEGRWFDLETGRFSCMHATKVARTATNAPTVKAITLRLLYINHQYISCIKIK